MRESYSLLDSTEETGAQLSSPTKEGLVRASAAALVELLGMGPFPEEEVKTVGLLIHGIGDTPEEQLADLLGHWVKLAAKRGVLPEIHGVSWDSSGIEAAVEIHEPDGSRSYATGIEAATCSGIEVTPPKHGGESWTARWVINR